MSLPPLNVPELLRRYGLRPDKSLGQNFLVDPVALDSVVDAAQITPDENVLEIGPGLGSLTRLLAAQALHVVAVELDDQFIPILQEILSPFTNITIVHGDILALNLEQLMRSVDSAETLPQESAAYQVVANIPYYISSAVIRRLLESPLPPERMVLTVQREVAERICARPGEMSLLALSVQVYGAPKIVAPIPAGAFYPAPKVDSAVVRIDLSATPVVPPYLLPTFFRLAKAGFSQKRKTLRNSVSGGMGWSITQTDNLFLSVGIDSRRRAETLSIDEWHRLAETAIIPTTRTAHQPENAAQPR
jgi:16S rRNA (adenine1518-N6/adenine1519-N6)-dimethyltransferase